MIKKPSLIILDVDGVMTSGKFLYSSKGKIFKEFGAHDNDGIKYKVIAYLKIYC